ncbi:hypothetical protein [Aureibacter tunicatorum]|uniref:Uncharacterized protein n=1 Tax=Aureibacter tunicatorum TaxID=866807 RepID=A0AAE3XKJ4_9BACT|nr:hypothetical protein [Aureibacter tunicatorum]MDR6237436.1 hypothetical protein [Aureibacter tunicatorum]BDD06426.1 hypothetical protein AUTU_39090 [Aureibacter tunicatorum]
MAIVIKELTVNVTLEDKKVETLESNLNLEEIIEECTLRVLEKMEMLED